MNRVLNQWSNILKQKGYESQELTDNEVLQLGLAHGLKTDQ